MTETGGRGKRPRACFGKRVLPWLLIVLVLFGGLAGCGTVADIRAEQRAEALARKYGERLPESELGPYKGFTREEYFKHKCETEAGEFIYKTVEDVESVYQMRLRDPRDFIDRLRVGDIPEDPWGHTDADARTPWEAFVTEYHFFETTKGLRDQGDRWKRFVFAEKPPVGKSEYWRYRLGLQDGQRYYLRRPGEKLGRPLVVQPVGELKSRYGYDWREVRDRYDRHFGVWGGEMSIKDLQTGDVLAIKRGYFDARLTICPKDKDVLYAYDFVRKVLKPAIYDTQGE